MPVWVDASAPVTAARPTSAGWHGGSAEGPRGRTGWSILFSRLTNRFPSYYRPDSYQAVTGTASSQASPKKRAVAPPRLASVGRIVAPSLCLTPVSGTAWEYSRRSPGACGATSITLPAEALPSEFDTEASDSGTTVAARASALGSAADVAMRVPVQLPDGDFPIGMSPTTSQRSLCLLSHVGGGKRSAATLACAAESVAGVTAGSSHSPAAGVDPATSPSTIPYESCGAPYCHQHFEAPVAAAASPIAEAASAGHAPAASADAWHRQPSALLRPVPIAAAGRRERSGLLPGSTGSATSHRLPPAALLRPGSARVASSAPPPPPQSQPREAGPRFVRVEQLLKALAAYSNNRDGRREAEEVDKTPPPVTLLRQAGCAHRTMYGSTVHG